MVSYKVFKVSDDKALNEFIKKNPPLGDKDSKDSGIAIHEGNFIVRYEDGTPINEKALALSNLHQALNHSRSTLIVATIQAQTTEMELKGMFKDLTLQEIMEKPRDWFVKFFQDKKLSYKQACELADTIQAQRQQRIMDEATADRTEKINIPILESLIESYE
jgi:hypothetical protein